MNINKVVFGSNTLIDLTEDTVHPDRMYKGDTAHAADGSEITGTAEVTVDGTCLLMPDGLVTPIGTVDPDTYHWIRPEGLPDLDSLYNGENNTIYMTVDATGRITDPHIYIRLYSACTVQVGHIQNGAFVADSTDSVANAGYWEKVFVPAADYYPIVKITSNEIRGIYWTAWTSPEGRAYAAQYQPVIEWIGCVNYMDNNYRTPYFTEREKINVKTVYRTALASRWLDAWSLLDLDVSDWDTTSWGITSLSQTWRRAYSIKSLDLSSWDTSNWTVNDLHYTWEACYQLEVLKTNGWDTSKFTPTNLDYTWESCYKLKKLDLNHWDTSNWIVTTIYETWYYCYSLEELLIDKWDTSKWAITSFGQTWNSCYKLKKIGIENWDTSNWKVQNFSGTFTNCYMLEKFEGENWDTSNWEVTSCASTFVNCFSISSLDLHWDMSNWNIEASGIGTMFSKMLNLKSIDFSHIDISNIPNWKSSGSTFMFQYDYLLSKVYFGTENLNKMHCNDYPIINFSNSNMLTRESLLNIINALENGVSSKTLQLGTTNLNKLTAEEKAIATNKGWTLT